MRAKQIRPTSDALEAFAEIVRGRQFLDQQTPESLSKAMAMFEHVAQMASDYARGYSSIADCTCDMFRLGLISREEARSRALGAAKQALAIDPSSVEAYASFGTVAAWLDFGRRAETSFIRSIGLGENARARRVFGAFLTIRERHEEAEAIFREARGLELFSTQQDIAEAVCHYQSRRFDLLLERNAGKQRTLPLEAKFHVALADIAYGDGTLAAEITAAWRDTMAVCPTLLLAKS